MRGFVFYDGPSALDGAPIIGIAVLHSKNRKTGNMVQTFIIRADQSPLEAIATGDDASICGDCVRPVALAPVMSKSADRSCRFSAHGFAGHTLS